jgi:CheY-like chemotaxis protein
MLCRLLRNAGYFCTQAENGQIAVDLVSSGLKFDLILMDFEMPVMDGPSSTRILKSMGCLSPVVGITGNILPDDIAFFLSAGAVDVLHKPLTLSVLNEMVAKIGAC